MEGFSKMLLGNFMPEKTIPVAIVTEAGGAHLGAYFAALRDTPECDGVVLCDPGGSHLQEAKKVLGEKLAAAFKTPEEMLSKAKPELAMVSMEAVNTPPVISKLLDSGCHVFAEKPACVRAEDFAPLVEKAEANQLQVQLALANRITPCVQKAKELIEGGLVGKLYGAEAHIVADQTRLTRKSYQDSWFSDRKRSGGGHLAWLGIHWLDLLMYLSGESITGVAGFSGNVGGQPVKAEDSNAMALRFENGAFGTLTSGYYLDTGYHTSLKLWGSDGWIEYREHLGGRTENPLRWYANKDKKIVEYDGPMEPKGYTPWVRQCVRAAAGLEKPNMSPAEALRVLKVIFAFYEAAEKGRLDTNV
ncbi:MAG: Gfo/Idh/MocA family oxidoreductase [Verrucomicrobiales bacterium]|nr:Gfo/Idh/MocA family oxidoreductase [Verrucomicrobiales bacterium]